MTDYLDELLDFIQEYDVLPDVPVANALVPFNPQHWPGYYAGSVLSSDEGYNAVESLATPAFNLIELYEYLDESPTTPVFMQRVDRVVRDTAYVNTLAELGSKVAGETGAVAAGIYANECCEAYMTERILAANTELSIEQRFEIAITRRKMQEAILNTKGMTYDEALEICVEKDITMDQFLGMEGVRTKVGFFLDNAPDEAKRGYIVGVLDKIASFTKRFGTASAKIVGLLRNIGLSDHMMENDIIEENPDY